MSKKKLPGMVKKTKDVTVKGVIDDVIQAIAVYERCRYGTVAPDDAVLPAAHAATALRAKYASENTSPDWGEVLLSVAVSARRSGLSVPQMLTSIQDAAARWVELGQVPHPDMPHAVPGTHPGSLLD